MREKTIQSGSLVSVRKVVCFLVFVAAVTAYCQREGVYQPAGGKAVAWKVNDKGSLIWDNTPFIPRGIHVAAQVEEIQRAASLGFKDVIIDLEGMNIPSAAIAEAEAKGLRYFLSLTSLSPSIEGAVIEPQGYRVDNITEKQHIEFNLPGAKSALVVLAVKRDGAVVTSKRVKIDNNRFVYDAEPGSTMEHVLLVYPIMSFPAESDYWETFDLHRDQLLTHLKNTKFGAGFRGIINPIGRALSSSKSEKQFVPMSRYFQLELRQHLSSEYKSLDTAIKMWGMGASDIETYEHLSRLIPLWSGTRGTSCLWDPTTDRLYNCDNKQSTIWRDINVVIAKATKRRYNNLLGSIRKIVDIPVIQDWNGWNGPYRDNLTTLTGIGGQVAGKGASALVDAAARPASSNLQLTTKLWQVVTELQLDASVSLQTTIETLESLGYRGWFIRSQNAASIKQVSDYIKSTPEDASLADWSPKPLFFPENAMYPAIAQRLPAGNWWLPSPADGNRVDLGTAFSAYRYEDAKGSCFVLWSNIGTVKTKLFVSNPKSVTFETIDGSNCMPKVVKGGVEATIGEIPVLIRGIDDIPVPEQSMYETMARYDALLSIAEKTMRSVDEERFFYKDNVAGFNRNPSSCYTMLRNYFWKLNYRIGGFTWIEAEITKESTFSEISKVSGCSNGGALSLDIPTSTSQKSWYATYNLDVRSPEELDIWIAAKIPEDQRQLVKLIIGEEVFTITEPPVCPYSAGYAWYHLGKTKLPRKMISMRVEVMPQDGADLSIDAILFYPGSYEPRGSSMPDAMVFSKEIKKQKLD